MHFLVARLPVADPGAATAAGGLRLAAAAPQPQRPALQQRGHGARGHRPQLAAAHPPGPGAARPGRPGARGRAADGAGAAALGALLDPPGHRRLAQHARERRPAEPHRRRAGCGQAVSARPAQAGRSGPRHLCRQQPGGAARATLDRGALVQAIDGFQMQLGTAVGDAIVTCLAELFPDQGIDVEELELAQKAARPQSGREGQGHVPSRSRRVPPGSYPSAAIVLAGAMDAGPSASRLWMRPGWRPTAACASTSSGLGTVSGDVATPEGMLLIYMQLDEPTLREVARMTPTASTTTQARYGDAAQRLSQPRHPDAGAGSGNRGRVVACWRWSRRCCWSRRGVLSALWFRRLDA